MSTVTAQDILNAVENYIETGAMEQLVVLLGSAHHSTVRAAFPAALRAVAQTDLDLVSFMADWEAATAPTAASRTERADITTSAQELLYRIGDTLSAWIEEFSDADELTREAASQFAAKVSKALPEYRTDSRQSYEYSQDDLLADLGENALLTLTYKGQRYYASLLSEGVEYDGWVYPSLSKAASAIKGCSANGWREFKLPGGQTLESYRRDRLGVTA